MSDEAFGLHLGDPQLADLGDGRGARNQTRELRHNYGEVLLGTLTETLLGGNHVRYWQQGGSGAYFLAASAEKDVRAHHDIVPDGYDLGRDQLVGKLIGRDLHAKPEPGLTLTGESHALGWSYETTVEYVPGLMDVDHGECRRDSASSAGGPRGARRARRGADPSDDQPPRDRVRRRPRHGRARRRPHRAHQEAGHHLSMYGF